SSHQAVDLLQGRDDPGARFSCCASLQDGVHQMGEVADTFHPIGANVAALRPHRRPNDNVSEWLREGALQSLRRGRYLAGAPLRSTPVCLALVANHLHGPSYVSLDPAGYLPLSRKRPASPCPGHHELAVTPPRAARITGQGRLCRAGRPAGAVA
ncbi:MAG: hypothetical protein ACKOPT_15345, partial [Cyanobium sp.]